MCPKDILRVTLQRDIQKHARDGDLEMLRRNNFVVSFLNLFDRKVELAVTDAENYAVALAGEWLQAAGVGRAPVKMKKVAQ